MVRRFAVACLDAGDKSRAVLTAHISIFLERRGSSATADDIKRLIFERDNVRHPSEYFADLVTIFNASDDDLDALLPNYGDRRLSP